MIRSAVRLPIPGTAWKRFASPGGDRAEQVARRAARERRHRDLGADAADRDQLQEEVALLLAGEAVELQRVLARDEMGVQRRLARRAAGTALRVSAETASR